MARDIHDRTAPSRRPSPACLHGALFLLVLSAWIWTAVLPGCGRSTAPEPDPEFIYTWSPEESSLRLPNDQHLDFRIADNERNDWTVDWLRNGVESGLGPRYRFYPQRYGLDTLEARISYPEGGAKQRWIVDVVPPVPSAFFYPPDSTLYVIETLSVIFHASSNRSRVASYRWLRDGAEVCTDTFYVYESVSGGAETIRCEIAIEDTVLARGWTVESTPLTALDLPEVENVEIGRGGVLGEFHVAFDRVDSWYLPIVEYRILASHSGPITPENAGDAFVLDVVPHVDETRHYWLTYDAAEEPRLISGEDAWITVVAVDARGALSPPTVQPAFLVPLAWYAEGTVRTLDGEALSGMIVHDVENRFQTSTDAEGRYRIGPYSDLLEVTLLARPPIGSGGTAPHPAFSPKLNVSTLREHDFRLIPRLGVDPDCSEYQDNFVNFLRRVTMTLYERTDRPNHCLYRWDSWPLRIYVPAYRNPLGVDFGTAARSAVRIWDDQLGGGRVELCDSIDDAHIIFHFGETGVHRFGHTMLIEPGDGSIILGGAIPELIRITIFDLVSSWEDAEIISLHELGHALGIIDHTLCSDVGYLMYIGPSSDRENWPEHAVHPDELNAIHTLMKLPQGQDMSLYPLD